MKALTRILKRTGEYLSRFNEKYPRLVKTSVMLAIISALLWFVWPIKADDIRMPVIIAIVMLVVFQILMRQQRKGLVGGKRSGGLKLVRDVETRFSDVAGCDNAKFEVREMVELLTDPRRFSAVNAKVPTGGLLIGSPGNGKTLLAKAIAGEAGVPFFSISGSDFVEMYVGVGAARVRDMFETLKKNAPCVVFIDEIDAMGKARSNGRSDGGTDERESTLNQLLVELDGMQGFDPEKPVLVIGATNRPDTLDPALLRPGRFTRHIPIDNPNTRGREEVIEVHMKKVPLAPDINTKMLARTTSGFSGADLANLVNEAAIGAARDGVTEVSMKHFEKAKSRVLLGLDSGKRMSDDERRDIAYHEAGHAVVAELIPVLDPVTHVSIIPRRTWLGVTISSPVDERYVTSKNKLLASITMAFGGRVAEEIFVEKINAGAAADYATATELARKMVTKLAMGDPTKFAQRVYGENESERMKELIDNEINRILDEQYALTKKLLLENRDKVEEMVTRLLEDEEIDASEVNRIMRGDPTKDKSKVTVH